MAGFYSWDQLALVEPYFEKYYEVLQTLKELTSSIYLETFFYQMLPRMKISDSHIVKLVSLKQETPDNEQMFASMLQDGIELLIRSK